MKRLLIAFVLLLFLSVLTSPEVSLAEGPGRAANGSFQLSFENGVSWQIQFDAKLWSDGNTTGEIAFHDANTAVVDHGKSSIQSEEAEAPRSFYAKATCDCLLIDGVEAVLGGTVTEASHKNFIGRRVLIAVQDGDSLTPRLRDKFTFGFYRTTYKSWIATDGERPDDNGSVPGWLATDAERPDDLGILSHKSDEITCNSFPLSSHSFIGSKQGQGKIHVTH